MSNWSMEEYEYNGHDCHADNYYGEPTMWGDLAERQVWSWDSHRQHRPFRIEIEYIDDRDRENVKVSCRITSPVFRGRKAINMDWDLTADELERFLKMEDAECERGELR